MAKLSSTIAIVLLIISALIFGSCTINVEKRDLGKDTQKSYNVSKFNALAVSDNAEIIYTISDTISVLAKGKEGIINDLKVNVDKDSTLHISYSKMDEENSSRHFVFYGHDDNEKVTLYISGPDINSLTISGRGAFKCEDVIKAQNMHLSISGEAEINVDTIKTQRFSLDISGAAAIDIKGIEADKADFQTSGASDINVRLINVASTNVSIAGAGDFDADFKDCGMANVNIAGAGSINLSGNVKDLKKSVSGVGNVNDSNLKVGE